MLKGFFFNTKPVLALASLAKKDRVWYASMLAKEIDCTYPHIINITSTLENAGLITTEGQGRIKIIRLTPRGKIWHMILRTYYAEWIALSLEKGGCGRNEVNEWLKSGGQS